MRGFFFFTFALFVHLWLSQLFGISYRSIYPPRRDQERRPCGHGLDMSQSPVNVPPPLFCAPATMPKLLQWPGACALVVDEVCVHWPCRGLSQTGCQGSPSCDPSQRQRNVASPLSCVNWTAWSGHHWHPRLDREFYCMSVHNSKLQGKRP